MFILPSLGRPESVDRFLKAYRDTQASAPVVVWIGTDDPHLQDYRLLDYPPSVMLHIDQPMKVGQAMQAFYERWPDAPMYGYLADDVVPRSLHWDRSIVRACGDWGFVTINEGLPDEATDEQTAAGLTHFRQKRWHRQPDDLINSNFPMVGGELVRALGGFMVAGIEHFETDVFWQRVAVTLNVHQYRDDIVLEHMHHMVGKSKPDKTYLKYNDKVESPGYRGWRKDLLTHLKWWTDLDNLQMLDRIKRRLGGTGLTPPCTIKYNPLEQLQRTHTAELNKAAVTFKHDQILSAVRVEPMTEPADVYPVLADGYSLEVENGTVMVRHAGFEERIPMNRSAAMVLTLCDGEASAEEIADSLQAFYPEEGDQQVRQDVLDSIDQLYQFCVLDLSGKVRKKAKHKKMAPTPQREILSIIAYRLNDQPRSDILEGDPQRDWMNESNKRSAYRCLPLCIANQTGWDISCPVSFTAIWSGGKGTNAVRIEFYDTPSTAVVSHFGEGVLTFSIDYLFRTSAGHNLWIKGPPNSPRDGIVPLEGIVETDWLPFTFTMNWKFTRHHHPVHFDEGEPICRIVPYPRDYASRFETKMSDLADDPELAEQFERWSLSRSMFTQGLNNKDPAAVTKGWQRDYTLGRDKSGKRYEFHETRVKLASFKR